MKLLAAAALLATQTPGPPVRCMPQEQFSALVAALLPLAVARAESQCRQHSGSMPFLASAAGRTLGQRLRSEAGPHEESAGHALLQVSGMPLPRGATGQSFFEAMGPTMIQMMPALDAATCRTVDNLLSAAAPMPSINIGRMLAAFVALAPPESSREGPPVCQA